MTLLWLGLIFAPEGELFIMEPGGVTTGPMFVCDVVPFMVPGSLPGECGITLLVEPDDGILAWFGTGVGATGPGAGILVVSGYPVSSFSLSDAGITSLWTEAGALLR